MLHLSPMIFSIGLLALHYIQPAEAQSAHCFFRNGSNAIYSDGKPYIPCAASIPGSFCCPTVDQCMPNGLCRDTNNHLNGSLTDFPSSSSHPGIRNFTGLFHTPACQTKNWIASGCLESCTGASTTGGIYIWSCNDIQTSYCCHNDAMGVLQQHDCCNEGTFALPQPDQTKLDTNSTSPANITAGSLPTSKPRQELSHGLSQGTKLALGLGIALGLLLLVAVGLALVWYFRHKRQVRGGLSSAELDGQSRRSFITAQKAELDAFSTERRPSKGVIELPTNVRTELSSDRNPDSSWRSHDGHKLLGDRATWYKSGFSQKKNDSHHELIELP